MNHPGPNVWLVVAGFTAVAVAVIHSVLGERLVFRRLRDGTVVPAREHPLLPERHLRILWATWHVVSVFGLGIAAMLFHWAGAGRADSASVPLTAIALSMTGSSLLVLVATRGRHPGWIGLLLVAAATWLAR